MENWLTLRRSSLAHRWYLLLPFCRRILIWYHGGLRSRVSEKVWNILPSCSSPSDHCDDGIYILFVRNVTCIPHGTGQLVVNEMTMREGKDYEVIKHDAAISLLSLAVNAARKSGEDDWPKIVLWRSWLGCSSHQWKTALCKPLLAHHSYQGHRSGTHLCEAPEFRFSTFQTFINITLID